MQENIECVQQTQRRESLLESNPSKQHAARDSCIKRTNDDTECLRTKEHYYLPDDARTYRVHQANATKSVFAREQPGQLRRRIRRRRLSRCPVIPSMSSRSPAWAREWMRATTRRQSRRGLCWRSGEHPRFSSRSSRRLPGWWMMAENSVWFFRVFDYLLVIKEYK